MVWRLHYRGHVPNIRNVAGSVGCSGSREEKALRGSAAMTKKVPLCRSSLTIYFHAEMAHRCSMIWSTTATGETIYVSPEWTSFTGQPTSEALGDGWLKSLHLDDVEPTRQTFEHALRLRSPFVLRYRLFHVEHGYIPVIDAATPSFSSIDNAFIGYIGTVTELGSIPFDVPDSNVVRRSLAMPAGALTAPTRKADIIADYLLLARATAVNAGIERMLPSIDFAISEVMRELNNDLHGTVQ